MATQKTNSLFPTYFDQIKFVLENYHDPELLGLRSPLAAPYFLGKALAGAPANPAGRGRVLRTELDKALEMLWGEKLPNDTQTLLAAVSDEGQQAGRGDRYDCLVLELNYFKRAYHPTPKSQAEIYNDILHISRATHDRHLHDAVERLAKTLLRRLRPSLRLEAPILETDLIGRDSLAASALALLQTGKSVALSGAGGVGKTALGIFLSEQWHSPAIFWYTVRPTLNDHLATLLFTLGYFLHRHAASTLWHQLVVDGGKVRDFHLGVGLARADLASLAANFASKPLLCFDEIDFLRPLDSERYDAKQTQLLEFIDSLRGYVPLLLISQRSVIEADAVYRLDGFATEQIAEWLHRQHLPFTNEDVVRLHRYSEGNPRLLELSIAFYQTLDEPKTLSQTLDQLPHSPALPSLWQRIQRRLSKDERQLLCALSVFRSPSPMEAWKDDPQLDSADAVDRLTRLQQRRLLRQDEQGGVFLLPALRTVIYAELTIEARQSLHQQAAQIRSQWGEYTAAAYHYLQADQPQQAIDVWYPHRSSEITHGHGGAASAIFAQVSLQRLASKQQKQLALLRGELYQLSGEPAKTIEAIEQVAWSTQEEESVDAALLSGRALGLQGKSEAAMHNYAEGIQVAVRLLNKLTHLQTARSRSLIHRNQVEQAWREAALARYHVENLHGTIHGDLGNYSAARTHYRAALGIAEELNDLNGMAYVHHCLAIFIGKQQGIEAASPHYEKAIEFYECNGDRVNREMVRSNLASTYIQSRQFAAALEPAQKALKFFQQIGDSVRIAQNATNLADAHAELGNLEQAEHYAGLVLEEEDPRNYPYAMLTMGTVRSRQQRWVEAEAYYRQAANVAEMNEDSYVLAFIWRGLAEMFLSQNKLDAAAAPLQQALALFQKLEIADELAKTKTLAQKMRHG